MAKGNELLIKPRNKSVVILNNSIELLPFEAFNDAVKVRKVGKAFAIKYQQGRWVSEYENEVLTELKKF